MAQLQLILPGADLETDDEAVLAPLTAERRLVRRDRQLSREASTRPLERRPGDVVADRPDRRRSRNWPSPTGCSRVWPE